MIPLLPHGDIFHSRLSSKFSYSSWLTMSPPSLACQFPSGLLTASRMMALSEIFQLEPIVVLLKLCQPAVVFPSNNNFHPLDCSEDVSELSGKEGAGITWTGLFAGIVFMVYQVSVVHMGSPESL